MALSPTPPLGPGDLLPPETSVLENPWLGAEPKSPSVDLPIPVANPWTSETSTTETAVKTDTQAWNTDSIPLAGSEWANETKPAHIDNDDDDWDEPQWLVQPSVSPPIKAQTKLLSPQPILPPPKTTLPRKPPQFDHAIIKKLFDDNDLKVNYPKPITKTYPEAILQDEPNATRYYNDLQRYTPQLLKEDGTNSIVRWVDSHIQVSQRVVVDSWAGVSLGLLKKKQQLKANKLFKWASSDAYAEQIKRDYMIKTGVIDPSLGNNVDAHQQDKAPPGILNLVVNPKLSQQVFEKLTHLIEQEANRFVRIRIEKKRLQLTEAMAHQISERKRKDHENHLLRLKLREEEYEREGLTTTDKGSNSSGGAAAFFNQLNFWGSSKKKAETPTGEPTETEVVPLFLETGTPEDDDDEAVPEAELNPGDKAIQAFTKLFSTSKKKPETAGTIVDDEFDDFQKALTPTPEPQPVNGANSPATTKPQPSPASIASANKPMPNIPRPSDDFADFTAAPALPSKPKKQVLVAHNLPMAPLIPLPNTATLHAAGTPVLSPNKPSTILSPSSNKAPSVLSPTSAKPASVLSPTSAKAPSVLPPTSAKAPSLSSPASNIAPSILSPTSNNTKLATQSPDPFKLDSILSPKAALPMSTSFKPLSTKAAPLQPSSRPQLRPVSMMVTNDNHRDVLNELEIARSVSPAKTSHPFIPLPAVTLKEQNLVDLMDVFGQLPSPPPQDHHKRSKLAANASETNLLDL